MIFDRLENISRLACLEPGLAAAAAFLAQTDLTALAEGRTGIDTDRVFAMKQAGVTRPLPQCRFESHARHIDIHVVALGCERVGFADPARLGQQEPYDRERDVAFFGGRGDILTLRPGSFLLFWPGEPHMPGVALRRPAGVQKIVVKILAERPCSWLR